MTQKTSSKIAIITDVHLGVRGDSVHFHDYMEQFFRTVFFPEIDKNGITTIVCLGDIFDVRKTINLYTLARVKEYFFTEVEKRQIHLTIIVGNHDVYFKNSNEINSPDLLLREYKNIDVIFRNPEVREIHGKKISFIPWINNSNLESTMDFIKNDSSTICFAHLELEGFDYQAGVKAKSGMSPAIFENYTTVLTGHYHSKSSKGNVHYLGTMFDLTWADCDEKKYWHIFDVHTCELIPIENQNKMFIKLFYDDSEDDFETALREHDFSRVEGKFVKIIVEKKTKPILLEVMIEKISQCRPLDIAVVDNTVFGMKEGLSSDILVENTLTIMKKTIDLLEVDVSKDRLYNTMIQIYDKANADT